MRSLLADRIIRNKKNSSVSILFISTPNMPKPDHKNEIYIGMALIGTTGLLIGLVMDSPLLMVIASFLGLVVGGFVGWLGGYRYMVIICVGVLVGAYFGYRTGDRDILIISAGTGGAIAGFMGAQLELFFKK